MAGALEETVGGESRLPFGMGWTRARARRDARRRPAGAPVCAGCRAREARYGFRPEGVEPPVERPRTLCFQCFRMELDRRQLAAARLARGWNAQPVRLPLEERLRELTHRRRQAQIAARRAIGE